MQRERVKKPVQQTVKKTEFENPNIRIGSNKQGAFQPLSYTLDEYKDPDAVRREFEKKSIEKRIKAPPFKTFGRYPILQSSAYSYTELREGGKDPKRFRDIEGGVTIPRSNIKTGPVDRFFTKIEYKEDDFSRKELFRRSEYKKQKEKEYARGLFHNKITVEKPTFQADEEIFGDGDPSPLETLKEKHLREQAILNRKKTQHKVAHIARKKKGIDEPELSDEEEGNNPKNNVYVYAPPPYVKCGFDTRIFERLRKMKEKNEEKMNQQGERKTERQNELIM